MKSAKEKAQEFMKVWEFFKNGNVGILQNNLTILLEVHQDDLKREVVHSLKGLERHDVDSCFADGSWASEAIELSEAVRVVEGLK